MPIRERGDLRARVGGRARGPSNMGNIGAVLPRRKERGGQDSLPDRLQGDTAVLFYGSQCHIIRYFSHDHHVIGVGDKINGSIRY